MFLDLGKGDNIAMFYYFGARTKEEIPRTGTHHSFGAADIDELRGWQAWLEEHDHKILGPFEYEVMTSIYVEDPNGRLLEIAANHRELNAIDADDGELTAEALILAADEKAESIEVMWAHKARLIEEREGEVAGPALFLPNTAEFRPLADAALASGAEEDARGNFVVVHKDSELQIPRPDDIPESMWHAVGTGGIKGSIKHDERELVLT
jgi:hypothetical protein